MRRTRRKADMKVENLPKPSPIDTIPMTARTKRRDDRGSPSQRERHRARRVGVRATVGHFDFYPTMCVVSLHVRATVGHLECPTMRAASLHT